MRLGEYALCETVRFRKERIHSRQHLIIKANLHGRKAGPEL